MTRPSGWSMPSPTRWSSAWRRCSATRAWTRTAIRSPRSDGDIQEPATTPLSEVPTGATVEIRQVEEGQPDRLRYIASIGLRPGAQVTVVDRQPFQGPITIAVDGRHARHRSRAGRRSLRCCRGRARMSASDAPARRADRLALPAHPAEPARVARLGAGAPRRSVLAQGARLRRARLPGGRRLHGPGQLGHRPRRRLALRLHAAVRHPASPT